MTQAPVPQTQDLDVSLPQIHSVPPLACWSWLRQGWGDVAAAWHVSLAHGVLIAGLGWLLVNYGWRDYHWALTFTSGFLLVAPVLATCFYAISRARERGEPLVDLLRPLRLLAANGWSMGLFVIVLAMLFSLWERVTAIIVAMTLKADVHANYDGAFSFAASLLEDPNHLPVIIAFFAVGALFALAAFALTAVALPMIVDQRVDPVTAMLTSLSAVRRNPLAMSIWAGVIAMLVLMGYLTAFLGLIVIFPWLGHATWHAYRGLVAIETVSD